MSSLMPKVMESGMLILLPAAWRLDNFLTRNSNKLSHGADAGPEQLGRWFDLIFADLALKQGEPQKSGLQSSYDRGHR